MTSQEAFKEELYEDVRSGRVAVVLGTGFSSAVTGGEPTASWLGLLRAATDFLYSLDGIESGPFSKVLETEKPTTPDLVAVAQWVGSRFQVIPGEYANWLERTVGRFQVANDPLLNALPDIDHVLTTNYDTLWKTRLPGREAITWTDANAAVRYGRGPNAFVYHLHGVHSSPNSIILSGFDYGRLDYEASVKELLHRLATDNSLLFIGYGSGLNDPNFGPLMEWLREHQSKSPHRHYQLVREQDAVIVTDEQLRQRLTPITYGTQFHQLPGFLNALPWNPGQGADPVTQTSSASANADQSMITIRSTAGPNDFETLADRLVEAGLPEAFIQVLERQLGPLNALEDFQRAALDAILNLVQRSQSSLFFTVTGTGKTTLARIAMNLAVGRDGAAVALMPTKALVTQERGVWDVWQAAWRDLVDKRVSVYAASRDYPDADRPVSRARFDVAIAIYEKLALYMITGHEPLSNTTVLVIDELQILMEKDERGAKLEALLTMIRLLSADERPAILGLSPAMRADTTKALQAWLGVSESAVVQTNERPIPLDVYVLSPLDWIKQVDAHLIGIAGRQAPPPEPLVRHALGDDLRNRAGVLSERLVSQPSAQLTAVLVDHLLSEDPDRKIICFVPTRGGAEALAETIRALLKRRFGRPGRGSPWEFGRFATKESKERDVPQYDQLKFSALPSCEDVISSLRAGVAAHTATYPSILRRMIEDEFQRDDGLLRVIVATDTLAMGVNMPADTVIASSISGYAGQPRSKRLLRPENLANKAGRAGRRGKTSRPRGEFYLVVPSKRELEDISGLANQDLNRLSTIVGVLESFITQPESVAALISHYRDTKSVASLVLQVLCQDRHGRSRASTLRRIEEILDGMLLRHEPDPPVFSASEVLDELTSRKLIGLREKDGYLCLSGLGMALGTSSLDLDLATTLERLARLSTANAGRIDLLWNACRSAAIQEATPWVSLPPAAARHRPALRDAVLQIAAAYCSEDISRRRLCAASFVSPYSIPTLLIDNGSSVVSPELVNLLATDGELAKEVDVTALLRALVIFEWSLGIPFDEIKARFTSIVVSGEELRGEQPVQLRLHYADVEQLCDQVAGVLRGAASICIGDDGLDYSTDMVSFALEVEMGAPAWLVPLLKLRLPTLHRERFSFLWDAPAPDDAGDVLGMDSITRDPGVAIADLENARRLIELRSTELQASRNRVARRWASVRVPKGEGDSFGDISEELSDVSDAAGYVDILARLGTCLGVEVGNGVPHGFFASSVWSAGIARSILYVPHGDVTGEALESIVQKDGVLIASSRFTETARRALRSPHRLRVVEPEHLLTLIARLVEVRGTGVDATEVVAVLDSIQVSSYDTEAWPIYDGPLRMPPPFVGALPALDHDLGNELVTEEVAG